MLAPATKTHPATSQGQSAEAQQAGRAGPEGRLWGKRKENLPHSKAKPVAGKETAEPQVAHAQGREQRLVAVTQGTSLANRDREPLQGHTWFNSLPTSSPNIAHQSSVHRTPKNGDPKGTGALRHKSPTEAQGASVAAQGEGGFGGFPLLLNPPSEREQGKPSCPTVPKPEASAEHGKKNPHSPSRCTSAFPGTFHHHRDGSHRPWVPENPPAPPQRPAQTIPCPFACGSLRPGSLPVPSSSQHVRPGAAAPPWISPPSSPALLAATLHPCASSCLRLLPQSSPRNQQDKRCLARHHP